MDEFDYSNIIEVIELRYVETANEHLNLGWILLKIFGETQPVYVLGWNKRNGDNPVYPPKNEIPGCVIL